MRSTLRPIGLAVLLTTAAAIVATSMWMTGCGRNERGASAAGAGAAASSSGAAADAARSGRPPFGGDFTLTTHDGRPFHLADARGRPVLLFFGYTFCPDVCPMTIARIKSALDLLGGDAARVTVLFVSLDPKRDTPAVLKAYVQHFSPRLVGLTGTDAEIARVAAQYHVSYNVVQPGSPDYLLNHTTAIFLIDKQGRLYNYFPNDENPEQLARAVQLVLDGE